MSPPTEIRWLTSPDSLAWINARVIEDTSLTRYRLAKELCVRLDLRDAMGRPQETACRRQLLALQRLGRIELPPPRRKLPAPRPPASETPVWAEFAGTLPISGQ